MIALEQLRRVRAAGVLTPDAADRLDRVIREMESTDGDTTEHVAFTVYGKPIGKGRPRMTRKGHTYTPQDTRDAEHRIAWHAKAAMNMRPPLDGPIHARFVFVRPTRHRIDLDNLVKLAADAMNGICYHDDNQIVRIEAEKHVGDDPRTEIWLSPAPEGP